MVDRASLEMMGFILGGVTAVVVAVAAIVVGSHVGTNATVKRHAPVVPVSLSAQR